MLMYRFESSRSPTCKDTKHHFACMDEWAFYHTAAYEWVTEHLHKCLHLQVEHIYTLCIHAGAHNGPTSPILRLPVKPQDQVWSWGPEASSAPHPSSGAPSPAWEHKTTEELDFLSSMHWRVYHYKGKELDHIVHKPIPFSCKGYRICRYMPTGCLIVKLVIIFRSTAVNLNCTCKAKSSESQFGWITFLSLVFALSFVVYWFGYGSQGLSVSLNT